MKRRRFLRNMMTVGAVTGAGGLSAAQCIVVPPSGAGPMKPSQKPLMENDLTRVAENGPQACGQRMLLTGQVLTADCLSVSRAEVVIWQACVNGMYNHPNEDRKDWRDPAFRYAGRTLTDADGGYLFHTIIPGSYPVPGRSDKNSGLVAFRAPHIHFTVSVPGRESFTSQLFFDHFDDMNTFDLVLVGKSLEEQGKIAATDILTSSGYELLDRAALNAVSGWSFEPMYRDQIAIVSKVQIPVSFRLN